MREFDPVLFPVDQRPDFDGKTYERKLDLDRLDSLLGRVYRFMQDGEWHSLQRIKLKCGGSEASCSARLRDLRKEKFGGHTIENKRISKGLWRYRMVK